jgi:Uma2 family endonuclease
MATVPKKVEYPTRDGKPMAETTIHRDAMMDLIRTLEHFYAGDPTVYVSGNMLMFYEEGNKRRHLSPDVFVTLGIPKRIRDNYLMWEEGKGPDLVIEVTSKSTRREDQVKKRDLYRDVLHVREYVLFDPMGEYLRPPVQGYRLEDREYVPIEPVDGRLPSLVTGLHLEAAGTSLRLFSPELGRWLPTEAECIATEARRADEQARRADVEARRADAEAEARRAAEAEVDRLRRQLGAARRPGAGDEG